MAIAPGGQGTETEVLRSQQAVKQPEMTMLASRAELS